MKKKKPFYATPIQTSYKGYNFRSRLEARWAVYFSALPLEWEYEKEGYDLGGTFYLPDFWLPQVNMWAEVKPIEFTKEELRKIELLSKLTGYSCIMLVGIPSFQFYRYVGSGWFAEKLADYDEVALSNYHRYPVEEHRFFSSPGFDKTDPCFKDMFDDMLPAIKAARSARFEFGETPNLGDENYWQKTTDGSSREKFAIEEKPQINEWEYLRDCCLYGYGNWHRCCRAFSLVLPHQTAALLDFIINWQHVRANNLESFYCRSEDVIRYGFFTKHQEREGFRKLREAGFIETAMKGQPAKRWITINYKQIKEKMEIAEKVWNKKCKK